MEYSINQITSIIEASGQVKTDSRIRILLIDSRQLFFPAETLFFAVVTKNNDAHKYISELYDKQVRNFVVSKLLPEWAEYTDANFLLVDNTLIALQKLAAYHRKQFSMPVIGITGSNGKTIVKEWLYQVLSNDHNITRSPRSYNSQIGVPLSAWQINSHTEIALLEAGISEPNEMDKLELIIAPTIGIFTNIGHAHQENFVSLHEKCSEKLKLFKHSHIIICEEENEIIKECMAKEGLSGKRLTWSRQGAKGSFLQINEVEKLSSSSILHFSFREDKGRIIIPFTDNASAEDAIHVLATSLYLGMPIDRIQVQMAKLEPVAMRLDVREGKNNCTLINDFYNTDFNSLQIALDFLVQRAIDHNKSKAIILSDIPQTGMDESDLYSQAAGLIAGQRIDLMVGIGKAVSKYKYMFKNAKAVFFDTTEQFIHSGFWQQIQDMVILLKGARSFSFETINRLLEYKTHETVLDINLDAIVHNYKYYKAKLQPKTKMICMVKANGYGAGSGDIAKTLQYHKCDYLAVAVAEEGVALRKEGITLPIIVLNAEVGGFEELATFSLEPEVYNMRILKAFIKEARLQGISNYPVHIKLDTGMHRLGFSEEDIPELVELLKGQSGIRVHSIFSHLAASESWEFDGFTNQQIAIFRDLVRLIEPHFDYPIMKHILNSAGIERFPDDQMDMVRLGISLYGISASGNDPLQNVCTLKTTILQIKKIKKGETVGYGRKGQFSSDATIATIRIGYADGLSRQFGNGAGKVFVNGAIVPIVGNVCMDLTMIDVTGLDVHEGDTVIIFGEEMPIADQAKRIGTIPYEILTSISLRVKHVYFKE